MINTGKCQFMTVKTVIGNIDIGVLRVWVLIVYIDHPCIKA